MKGCAEFCNLLLEANAGFFDAAPCALARNPESGCYMLPGRLDKAPVAPGAEAAAPRDALERFQLFRGRAERGRYHCFR